MGFIYYYYFFIFYVGYLRKYFQSEFSWDFVKRKK